MSASVKPYRPRHIDSLIPDLLGELPALMLVGPRATGKTTTALRHAKTVIRLDQEAQAAAVRADPDAVLRGLAEPVLIDEWQVVPGVLGAVKRAVDDDSRPGRYILTGSVRADLESETWPATGRVVRLTMFGMTQREQRGALGTAPFLDRVADGLEIANPSGAPDLRSYAGIALRGGFPQVVLTSSETAREHWLESYVQQVLTRDAPQLGDVRDPDRLRRYFEAYALNSAGVPTDRTIYESAGVNARTATAYRSLLGRLLITDDLPAWTSNRIKRLTRSPKRYVIDPALMGAILRLDDDAVMRDGDLLGRLLDTFVASELRAELLMCKSKPRLFHLRHEQGRHEVDIVAELGGGRVIGIEVKASASVDSNDAKHLDWLQREIGERFIAGVVFHTGPRVYSLGDKILAVPICALWS